MAQVKKEAVRLSILAAAQALFTERGYNQATLPAIARRARVSPSTVYVYFRSKLEIVFTIYGPWLRARLERLEADLDGVEGERARLRLVVSTVWQDIPNADGGFANILMQALSSATLDSDYDPGLLHWSEGAVGGMLMRICGKAMPRARALVVAHMLFMCFDGFALNARINPASSCSDALVDTFVDMVLAGAAGAVPTARRAGAAHAH